MQLFVITLCIVASTVLVIAVAAPANDHGNEYDYEEDVEPAPVPVAPVAAAGRGRISLLNTRAQRGPSPIIGNRGTAAKTSTTAKPVEPSPEQADSDELDEEVEESQDDVPVTTTTEAPKKSLVRGGVRPFRSNEDLLAALKRRREQQVHSGSPKVVQVYPTPSTAQPNEDNKTSRNNGNSPQGAANSGRKRFNSKASAAAGSSAEPVVAEQPDAARRTTTRRYPGRTKSTTAAASDSADLEEEATPKPKPSTFRRRP